MRAQSETSSICQRAIDDPLFLFSFSMQMEDGVQIRYAGGCIINMCYGKLVCQPDCEVLQEKKYTLNFLSISGTNRVNLRSPYGIMQSMIMVISCHYG